MTTYTIEAITSKNVTTKYGEKQSYSFKADGEWFNHGFKKPEFSKGDVVGFEFSTGRYGKDVDVKSVYVVGEGIATSGPSPTSSGPAAKPVAVAPSYSKPFPIPALHGDRAIIRQNALTNARELFVASHGGKPFALDISTNADLITAIARKFEAYSTGDLDMEAAMASMKKESAE
jgi:hypothetical protein